MGLGIVDNKRAFLHFEPPQTEAWQVVDGAFPFYATCWKIFHQYYTKKQNGYHFFSVNNIKWIFEYVVKIEGK